VENLPLKDFQTMITRSVNALLGTLAAVVAAFGLIAIVACGTYLGNMASARALQAEEEASMDAFRKQLDAADANRLPTLPGDAQPSAEPTDDYGQRL
jgi:uncharacterized membrane protein YccC